MAEKLSGDLWDAAAYEAFHDLRLRPALDLLARVPSLPTGEIVDLGCGSGAAGAALRGRFPGNDLRGVDASAEMLLKADGRGAYHQTEKADIAVWSPASPPALIFSNAALHWLDDHARLIPRLFNLLTPGGALAVQMPSQLYRSSHQAMIAAAAEIRPDLFESWTPFPGHLPPGDYAAMLPEAEIEIWTTEYHQRLAASADGAHPVRLFSSSTAGLPVLALLDEDETAAFLTRWDEKLESAYPRLPDGGAWFPFRRFFFVARKGLD